MRTIHSLATAFRSAFDGYITFFRYDRNGQLQLAITAAMMLLGLIFKLAITEWCILLLCISLVIGLEMINTAIEKICDRVNPNEDPLIKIVKDVAAGAVLLVSLLSAVIGLLIFIPKMVL